MESLGAAAKRLLAKLDRDAQAMETSSERSKNVSEEFAPEPNRREEEAAQSSGIRREGSGLEKEGGQPGFRVSSFSLIADDAGRPDRESFAGTDRAKIITLAVFRKSGGSPRPLDAPATIVPFPVAGAAQARRMGW